MTIQTILVPTDFTAASGHAYEAALVLARLRAPDARIVLLHVLELGALDGWRVLVETPDDIEAELTREAFERLEATRAACDHEGIEVSLRVVSGWVAEGTCEVAEEEDVSLIVCGATHRSKVGAAILGTSAHAILSASQRPTLIVPGGVPSTFSRLLAPIDLDERPHVELAAAKTWAVTLGADIEVVHAVSMPTSGGEAFIMGLHEIVPAYLEARTSQLDALLEKQDLGDDIPQGSRHVEFGQPHDVIRRTCESRGIDIVVLASRCRDHLTSTLLGGTASRLLRDPPVPVLVLPPTP